MTANELDIARKHGLALRDSARPELGWRRVTTFAIPNFTGGRRSGRALFRTTAGATVPMTLKEQLNNTTMKEQV